MFIITGSTIMPAISPGWSSSTRRTASSRPNGTTWVSAATSAGDGAVLADGARLVGRAGGVDVGVHRDLHRVVVAVVAALDLDDPAPAGRPRASGGWRPAWPRCRSWRSATAAGRSAGRARRPTGMMSGTGWAKCVPAATRARDGGDDRRVAVAGERRRRSRRAGRRTRCRRRPRRGSPRHARGTPGTAGRPAIEDATPPGRCADASLCSSCERRVRAISAASCGGDEGVEDVAGCGRACHGHEDQFLTDASVRRTVSRAGSTGAATCSSHMFRFVRRTSLPRTYARLDARARPAPASPPTSAATRSSRPPTASTLARGLHDLRVV